MPDQLSALYSEFLEGGYDCVDRVILNAYFSMGQSGGGLRVWWRELYGSDENLDDNHLMRMAGRFSRRLRAWAKANNVPRPGFRSRGRSLHAPPLVSPPKYCRALHAIPAQHTGGGEPTAVPRRDRRFPRMAVYPARPSPSAASALALAPAPLRDFFAPTI